MSETGIPVEVPATVPLDAERRLRHGDVTLVGRMPNASNATFLVRVGEVGGDDYGLAIYKPVRGERPLWDFPAGLYKREAAAYLLSRDTGLGVIPPTVIRADAPLGVGSLQWFINADFTEHYFSLAGERPHLHDRLRALCVFDILANNTDRKSGHCLYEPAADRVWGIDNGLCFSQEARLRTVIWDFGGEPIAASLLQVATSVAEAVPGPVAELLSRSEIEALRRRACHLGELGTFPHDETGRGYPWPLI